MEHVLAMGAFHPDPGLRPQTVEGARKVLEEAVAIYAEQRIKEESLEREGIGGAPVEDEAGG